MSDIKAGDWVMVVRPMPCCGGPRKPRLGHTFIVRELDMSGVGLSCDMCGAKVYEPRAVGEGHRYGYTTSRLIKIDPPPKRITREEEITA